MKLAAGVLRLLSHIGHQCRDLGAPFESQAPDGTTGAALHDTRLDERYGPMQILQRVAAAMHEEIRAAIAGNAFFFEYQPVVSATSGAVKGYEALARWQRGPCTVGPDLFVPIA